MRTILMVIGVYLLILFAIGIYYSRKNKNMKDFLLAGKSLGLVVATLTMTATLFGGGLMQGQAQNAYINGPMMFFYPLGTVIGMVGVGLLVKKMTGFSSYTSVMEYLEVRYKSKFLRTACALLSWMALVGILASQVASVVGVFGAIGIKDAVVGAILAMVIIIALTSLGGLKAVATINSFQIILVVIGAVWVTAAALAAHGGMGGVLSELNANAANLPNDYPVFLNGQKAGTLLWLIVPAALYLFIGQDVYQNLFACKNDKIARNTAILSGLFLAALTMLPTIIGLVARVDFPDLESSGQTASALSLVAIKYLPDLVVGIVLAAILSAVLSTADSILTAATSCFMSDFWRQFVAREEDPDSRKMLLITRIVTLLIGVLAIIISQFIPQIMVALTYVYSLFTAGVFVPIVLGVLWKKMTKEGAVAALVTGVIFSILGISGMKVGVVPGDVFSAAVAFVAAVVVSLFFSKKTVQEQGI